MNLLEHGVKGPEQPKTPEVSEQRDVRPPREIGISRAEAMAAPREIGEERIKNTLPREIDGKEVSNNKIDGGSYRECKQESNMDKHAHHIPAKEASYLSENDGPCIIMEREDHQQTASWGNSKEARQYRSEQKALIDQGKFREAFEMDKQDIQSKFGDKYDNAIAKAESYLNKLEQEGKIK